MIPEFVDIGSLWKVLPPGVHNATLDEVEKIFSINDHRQRLFSGLQQGVINLQKANCKMIYLDGSFITEKPMPEDYDVCWLSVGVDTEKLDSVLLDFSKKRKKQKDKYYGEYFPASSIANGVNPFYKFFQIDKYTGKAKGIIEIFLI